jgi:DNA-directed RNA polymerase subunit RPC12/RpoP
MTYHAHLEGFSRNFDNLDELRNWANDLAATYEHLVGKKLKIWRARSVIGKCGEYSATPDRVIVISAAKKCADCGKPAVTREADNTPLCADCDRRRFESRRPAIERRLHERLGHLGW